METLNDLLMPQAPTARRPLLGLTVLVVEDSRYASEALRLMCIRSGARIRRADSLATANRHLKVYRPTVAMIDVGLPDGSGIDLIKTLSQSVPRIDVILGVSGDSISQAAVLAAGADGFLEKPVNNVSAFQSAILDHLPADRQPPSPRLLADEMVSPDMVAYHDDLNHVAQVLRDDDDNSIDYVTQFLGGVARSAEDHELVSAVRDLVAQRGAGSNVKPGVAALSRIVEQRIAAGGSI